MYLILCWSTCGCVPADLFSHMWQNSCGFYSALVNMYTCALKVYWLSHTNVSYRFIDCHIPMSLIGLLIVKYHVLVQVYLLAHTHVLLCHIPASCCQTQMGWSKLLLCRQGQGSKCLNLYSHLHHQNKFHKQMVALPAWKKNKKLFYWLAAAVY